VWWGKGKRWRIRGKRKEGKEKLRREKRRKEIQMGDRKVVELERISKW
jgi:hypothetical protein